MADVKVTSKPRVAEVVERYGKCLELVPMDPNFDNISVGLYVKDGVFTIWTFSNKAGVEARIEKIRDQFVALGGMKAQEGTHNQAVPSCSQLHIRPVKFLLNQAVGKAPDYEPPRGEMSIKDSKSPLLLKIEGKGQGDKWPVPGFRRRRSAQPGGAATHGGSRLYSLRRNGQGQRHGGHVPLRGAPRRTDAAVVAILPQHIQR